MSRLFGMSTGKTVKLLVALQDAGMDEKLAGAIIDNGDVASDVVNGLRKQLALPVSGMFVRPKTQLDNVRRWNQERGWGFAEEDFAAAEADYAFRSRWPVDKLTVKVLVPYLDGVSQTFEELWTVASGAHPGSCRWYELKSDSDHLRLLDGITHRPGLRWEVIDLGANQGASPRDVCGPDWVRTASPRGVCEPGSAHAGVLAAAAHFPMYVQAMSGKDVPQFWLAGYQVKLPGRPAWRYVPILYWNPVKGGLVLTADEDHADRQDFSVPVRRNL